MPSPWRSHGVASYIRALGRNSLTWGSVFPGLPAGCSIESRLWLRVTVLLTAISRFFCRRTCGSGCRRRIAAWLVIEAVPAAGYLGVPRAAADGRGGGGGLRPGHAGHAAGLGVRERDHLLAADRAAVPAGRGVPGDLRRARARPRDGRPVPAAVRRDRRGPVRAGAGAVRAAGHGPGRHGRAGRHQDRRERVEGREPDRGGAAEARGRDGRPARGGRRGRRTPCSGGAARRTTPGPGIARSGSLAQARWRRAGGAGGCGAGRGGREPGARRGPGPRRAAAGRPAPRSPWPRRGSPGRPPPTRRRSRRGRPPAGRRAAGRRRSRRRSTAGSARPAPRWSGPGPARPPARRPPRRPPRARRAGAGPAERHRPGLAAHAGARRRVHPGVQRRRTSPATTASSSPPGSPDTPDDPRGTSP